MVKKKILKTETLEMEEPNLINVPISIPKQELQKKSKGHRLSHNDLVPMKTCIFGIQRSGKTHWTQKNYKIFKKPIIFVVNDDDAQEWLKLPRIAVWRVKRDEGLTEDKLKKEVDLFLNFAYKKAHAGEIDCIIFEEADLFFRTNYDLPFQMQDLVLNHRHIPSNVGVALWFVTRRPQDIPTKVVETSQNLIIFKLEGKNAIQRFNDIDPRIVPLIMDLKKYEYVVKPLGEAPYIVTKGK
jgi:hypothetical protein